MYLTPQFNAKERSSACTLMRTYPFASLISNDDDLPFVTNLPLHLKEEGDQLRLLSDVAKPNPHGKFLRSRPQAQVCFMGPYAYMSPSVYPDVMRVTDFQAKLKLNQHRPESHTAMHSSYASGGENERALAKWMENLGLVTPHA